MRLGECDPRELGSDELGQLLAQEIESFHPTTTRARQAKQEALAKIGTLVHPMDELANPVHVTASGFVMSRRGVLLHEHKSLKMWLQPGGHIEPGEWPPDAALREAREETGLHCVHVSTEPMLVRVDVHPGPRGHTHLDLGYLLTCHPHDPQPPVGESQNVSWFALEIAKDRCAADLIEFMDVLEAHWNGLDRAVREGVLEA